MTEERRTHVTVELRSKRLGLYLEPADNENRGAVLIRFERGSNGEPGEAELSGSLRPGFSLTGINDTTITHAQFPAIIAALIHSARPVRLTFRDPDVYEFRDQYDFLRTKLHVDRERNFRERSHDASAANDREWLAFLQELGGKRGVAAGVARLMRDANGMMVFPIEPSVRLNAVSPLHARMSGFSGAAVIEGGDSDTTVASAATSKALAGEQRPSFDATMLGRSEASGSSFSLDSDTAGDVDSPEYGGAGPAKASHSLLRGLPPAPLPVVVSIYKRCWSSSAPGVAQPPGLAVPLPGDLPPLKLREKYAATLSHLILRGGVPEAYRCGIT